MSSMVLKGKLIAIIDYSLRERAGGDSRDLVVRVVEKMGDDEESILRALNKVRIAVRLFVDEQLADDLYEELISVARPKK